MNIVRERFYFVIAMNKSTVIKSHDVTGPALMVKKSFVVHEPRLFSEFKLDLLYNLITVRIFGPYST